MEESKSGLLYKSGGQANMDNYRPMSILPVVSKIREKAVNVQFQHYLKLKNLLSPVQSGFRKHHLTLTAMTVFCDSIKRGIDNGKLTGAVFIVLRKAFDSAANNALIIKLKRFGIKNSLNWFPNYLYNRTQAVISIGETVSNHLTIQSGVPQGTILDPVLFTLYMNDFNR